MATPVRITFRDMDPTPTVETRIKEAVEKLSALTGGITSCHVVVEAPHKHHHKGRLFHVCIDLTVPGKEIAVGRHHAERISHTDVFVALRDAFRAARRALQTWNDTRRHLTKTREQPVTGAENQQPRGQLGQSV